MDIPLIVAVAMLALSWWLLKPRKRPVEKVIAETATLSLEQRRAASAEVAKMELRLLERQRELEAALQTRVTMLDSLIADADERIADLRQQIEFGDAGGRRRAA